MSTTTLRGPSPEAAARRAAEHPRLPQGDDERFTGFGVMGLPFSGGHCLALRVMTATSIGPAYRAVWHRTPEGAWTMRTTAPADLSCPRYFSSAAAYERAEIELDWLDERRLRVRVPGRLDWEVGLAETPATRILSAVGGGLPERAWRSDAVLAAMGPSIRPLLRAGRTRLAGAAPNRQRFRLAPALVWRVTRSTAVVDGVRLDVPRPLPHPARLGDFWMPQRGVFYVGDARFEARDPARHVMAA